MYTCLLLLLQAPTAATCCTVLALLSTSYTTSWSHVLNFELSAAAAAAAAAGPNSCNLLRRAGVAFDKLQKVLESCEPAGEGFGTPVGREFVGILSKVLLPNPQYCQRSTVATFQGQCDWWFVASCCIVSMLRQVFLHSRKCQNELHVAIQWLWLWFG
jgi:hypothetical protein